MTDATVYRWEDLPVDRPMPLISRSRIIGEKLMVSRVTLEQGFSVPTHHHENEQLAIVLSGRVRFTINEGRSDQWERTLVGGESILLPPNCPHRAEAIETTLIFDVFSPPSEKTGVDRR